jgi:hypothetical protein
MERGNQTNVRSRNEENKKIICRRKIERGRRD